MGIPADSRQRKTVPAFPRVCLPKPAPVSQIRERVRPQVKEDPPPTDEAGSCYSVVHPRTRRPVPLRRIIPIPPR
jgi:hypothetical protein